MRWLLTAATMVAVALAAALAVRTFKTPSREVAAPVKAAPLPCPDAALRPAPSLLEVAGAPLLLEVDPSVQLLVDGAAPGSALLEGPHALLATAPGALPAKLQIQVDAFTPVLLEARVSAGAVTVFLVGARCATCPNTGATPDLRYQPSFLGDLPGVARALAEGDWLQGAKTMRGVAPSDREGPEAIRLLAVLSALAGRPSAARETLEALPEHAPLRRALTRRDALEELKPVRQLETATPRWNATTERFQRLTDRFVAEAPRPLTELTVKFGALSKRFSDAMEKKDAIGCEAALESAHAALVEVIVALRAQRPGDCAWQSRVTAAF